ncbi:MAG: MarR family transcriptional regulator [Bacteroidota bacterium]
MDPSTAEEFVLLRNQLCFALYASSRMIVEAYEPILSPLGLTYEEYLVMMVLWEDAPVLEHDLVERLKSDAQTVAGWTDELEAKGFVRREATDEGALFAPTESGRDLRQEAINTVPDDISCRLLLPEDDISMMREGLYRMMANIEATHRD